MITTRNLVLKMDMAVQEKKPHSGAISKNHSLVIYGVNISLGSFALLLLSFKE